MPHIAFFGTSEFAVSVLAILKSRGIIPELIITTPDKAKGRHMTLSSPPAKIWAGKNNTAFLQPDNLKDKNFIERLLRTPWDVFFVASYGKILPKEIIEIPLQKTLNIHPSLLPKLRGSSPVQTAILEDIKETGVTIMLIDEKIDHGPIIAQKKVAISEWPSEPELENRLAEVGANLLADILPDWLASRLEGLEQRHEGATYTKKIEKSDALIDLENNPYLNYRKIQAYSGWPNAYFFAERKGKKTRVSIKEASFENGILEIKKVIPEGKREITYEEFLRGL